MAKKPDHKGAPKEKSGKGAMIMGLLSTICVALGLIATVILFAGLYDLGFIDLTHMLEPFAGPALLILILANALGPLAKSKAIAASAASAVAEEDDAKNGIALKIAEVEKKIETYLGENYNSLKTENENMKGEFEKIEVAERKKVEEEREKIDNELEKLRAQNIELQEQLNKNAQLINEQTMASEQLSAA